MSDQHELWLVRHGETEWTRTLQHTGTTDVPLTAAGEQQARALGERLRGHEFALVLSSPMTRALDTARLAGFGDRFETDDELTEWDYGDYEGRTTADIRKERPGWTLWDDGVPNGEIAAQVAARARHVIDRAANAGGDVALFAHGHVLRVLTARWCELDPVEGRRFVLQTGTLCQLGWEHEYPGLLRWNAT